MYHPFSFDLKEMHMTSMDVYLQPDAFWPLVILACGAAIVLAEIVFRKLD